MKKSADKPFEILAVDDDVEFLKQLTAVLSHDFAMSVAENASEALAALKDRDFDCVLLDMNLPEIDGLRILKMLRGLKPLMPVIMLTGDKTPQKIVQAIQGGAADYVIKEPKDIELEIKFKISRAIEQQGLVSRAGQLEKKVSAEAQKYEIRGFSTQALELKENIAQLKGRSVPVMITGESGTGKELVARSLNLQESGGLSRPFITVNCSAIPENLAESELFGHVKGAFTGAHQQQDGKFIAANGGDIFLDEIGDLSLPIQAKLLRVLQEREVMRVGSNSPVKINVRVIAATHKNLKDLIAQGKFREDLYYRLVVVTIKAPALRERKDDIPILVEYFLKEIAPKLTANKEAMAVFVGHDWPGNIRALKNCVDRAAIFALAENALHVERKHVILDAITSVDLDEGQAFHAPVDLLPETQEDVCPERLSEFTKWSEEIFFAKSFEIMNGNKSKLAERLSLSRDYVHRKLKSLGIGGVA